MGIDAATLSRLRWRSRRGMRELDQVLGGWLDRHADVADAEAIAAYEALLAVEDSEIWAWLMGRAVPPPQHAPLIDELRHPAQR
jgi:antitoxin CptB